MQACLAAQRYHDGPSHGLLECVGLAAIVWRAVHSRQRRWNGVPPPPEQGHLDAADFSVFFLRVFCVTLEYLFSKCQNIKKSVPKHQKICAPRICAKICAPRICAKNRFAHSGFPEDGSQKKQKHTHTHTHTQKKTSAPNLRKTPAPRGLGKGAGTKGSPVFLKPSKISLHSSIPPHWGPLEPRPPLALGEGGGEWESDRASVAEIPEPRP